MNVAKEVAKLSYCKRKQVGAVIVKDSNIISFGYNGTLAGEDNCCETHENTTKDEVVHAEANAILKLSGSRESAKGATLYLTLTPCIECSKMIAVAGIERVVYNEDYRCNRGVEKLLSRGITVEQLK